jgi:hypothetical protein
MLNYQSVRKALSAIAWCVQSLLEYVAVCPDCHSSRTWNAGMRVRPELSVTLVCGPYQSARQWKHGWLA